MVPRHNIAFAPVMVVEDDHDARVSLRSFLEEEGFEVITSTNGRDALNLLRAMPLLPGLVLLDLRMPIMDGWTFASVVKSDPVLAAVPLVVITADQAMPPANVIEVLRKPLKFGRLLQLAQLYCC
jgi:CheY-like chemotaxis protein